MTRLSTNFKARITPVEFKKYLGPPRFKFGINDGQDEIGLVNGLAYTSWGGNLTANRMHHCSW